MTFANRKYWSLIAAWLLLHPAAAIADPALDAVSISPEEFKVLLENDQVRVIEYEIKPGQRDPWHTHPAKVSYVVSGGMLRITTADGSTFVADEKAGTASWMGAVGRHYAENIGSTSVRIVLVEPKSGARALTEPSLVGAWRLVSMTTADASGTGKPLWGDYPSGFLLYTPDGHMAARTVTHTVQGAMVPDWIGTRLVRSYRFIDDDHVEQRVVSDAQIVVDGLVLVWERVGR